MNHLLPRRPSSGEGVDQGPYRTETRQVDGSTTVALPCLERVGTRTRSGYGMVYLDHVQMGAHRAAWINANGPIPDGLWVLHRCDNPPCIEPTHLFLGTPRDNIADRDRKGRTARGDRQGLRVHPEARAVGERHGMARLTDHTVREARAFRAMGFTYRQIASRYGVDRHTITDAIAGRTWGHV